MNFDRMKTLLIDRALQGQLVSNLQDFDPVDCSNDGELPFSIPKKWRVVSLDNLSTKITDGEHKTPSYQQEGIPFLSVKNISSGKVSFDDVKYITTEDYKLFSKGSVGNFVSRTIITGGQSSKVAHFLYGFSAGFGVCGGGGGGAHA